MIKFIYLILLFSLPIQALQILQSINDNQVIHQLDVPQLDTLLSAEQLLPKLKKLAKRGDARSQFSLAKMYYNGINVTKDNKLAFYWYLQVAEKGYASAQFNVANSYFYGLGIGKDLEQAFNWYKKAVKNGHLQAQYNLATLYLNGDGVEKNNKQAVYWYQKSAEQGYLEAYYHLALLQLIGNGIDKDIKKALAILLDLSSKGHQLSQYQLYLIYNKGEIVVKNDVLAKTYLLKAVKGGYAKAQYQLGKSFLDQDMDKEMAVHYLELAANQKNVLAFNLLETLQSKLQKEVQNRQKKDTIHFATNTEKSIAAFASPTVGVPKQDILPVRFNSVAANLIPNQSEIASSLSYNIKSHVNLEGLFLNAKQSNPIAQYNLNMLYQKSMGWGVRKENRVAFILIHKAANQGDTQSQNILAKMYINGVGIHVDYNKAYYWASVTTSKGSKEGKRILLYLIANL
ncbi:tetratricopeptide repeat protein [Candidatus Vesicomyidisocius sp. SY067_SCS001]|uniref:tetratricopeptide repeat protein n=1 Tax=Candidatus Vesicomyidisocius sp. SY067_SCS001 TaxID=2732590 RepID=UPI0016840638|nr:SEL1-like repeat protein [Candidatus Vesicomyosocius sp. SY067_SCS001]